MQQTKGITPPWDKMEISGSMIGNLRQKQHQRLQLGLGIFFSLFQYASDMLKFTILSHFTTKLKIYHLPFLPFRIYMYQPPGYRLWLMGGW